MRVHITYLLVLYFIAFSQESCLSSQCVGTADPKTPILLIPGIAGSILNVESDYRTNHVWAEYFDQDRDAEGYLQGYFNVTTRELPSRRGWKVFAPQDGEGLCSIVNLDPYLWVNNEDAWMFMEMVAQLSCSPLGYSPFQTIKGFPYDWRQSLRSPSLLKALHDKITDYASESPTNTINIISHSMGGLLVKSLLAHYPEDVKLITNWIAIGTPWGGSSDTIISLINGVSIGTLRATTEHLLTLQYPSFYELLALTNANLPDIVFNERGTVQKVTSDSLASFLQDVNTNFCVQGTWDVYCRQFSLELWNYAQSILSDLKEADKVIKKQVCIGGFNFVSIHGSQLGTTRDIHYETSVQSKADLIDQEPVCYNATGDGTVPLKEALTEPISTKYLYLGFADHQHMIRDSALISDIITLLQQRYNFGVLQPAANQPGDFCTSPPTSEEPTAEPSAVKSTNELSHLLTIVIIAASIIVFAVIIAVIVIVRMKARKKNYEQI